MSYLLGEFGNSQSSVGLSSLGRERGESGHEEVETGEGNHVDSQLAKISVQLSGESEAGGDSRHRHRNCRVKLSFKREPNFVLNRHKKILTKMVEVSVGGVGELEGTEADVVESFVVDAEGLVGVLDKLVDGERGVVGLHNGVRNLERTGSHFRK